MAPVRPEIGPNTAPAGVRPPFRAEIVGSLLRPQSLKEARERYLGPQTPDRCLGPHDHADLRRVEDACIRAAIALQEGVGLKTATDGEFRRRSWWLELMLTWEGLAAHRTGTTDFIWHAPDGGEHPFSRLWVNGPIHWRRSAIVRAFEFLKANTTLTPKVHDSGTSSGAYVRGRRPRHSRRLLQKSR